MRYAESHPDFDINTVTVFAENDFRDEFSYATEHVSHGTVINILLQMLKTLEIIKTKVDGDWQECIDWTNNRLSEVQKDSCAFPGLDAMLCASGFSIGFLLAEQWSDVEKENNSSAEQVLSKVIEENCKNTLPAKKIFLSLSPERKILFWLLSRFSLTVEQAKNIFYIENREKYCGSISDSEIIANPYILYETTRLDAEPVSFRKIDMGFFPPAEILERYPVPEPTALTSENDERRIRAVSVSILEEQAINNGHTIFSKNHLIRHINDLTLQPKCDVNSDIYNAVLDFLSQEFTEFETQTKERVLQLVRLEKFDDVIRSFVYKRLDGTRYTVKEDWQTLVDNTLEDIISTDAKERAREEEARKEKAAAFKELAESPLSVLVGGAGTGKTLLLSILCSSNTIKNGGVLLLAPTGKARVRMSSVMKERRIKTNAKTVALFLLQNGRYDTRNGNYCLSEKTISDVPQTVIIDESSMLTEEMFGALLQALNGAGRIIFVGDPNQLPPIGAGKPFVDLIRYIKEQSAILSFPRVGKGFGELTVYRRKTETDSLAVKLAEMFTGDENVNELDEDIFSQLQESVSQDNKSKDIVFKQWNTPDELENLLLETVTEITGMENVNDVLGFQASLGGTKYEKDETHLYFSPIFNPLPDDRPRSCGEYAEDWQILAPVKNEPYGVLNLNHLLHRKYYAALLKIARRSHHKKIASPQGSEQIVYGEKVINVKNLRVGKNSPVFGVYPSNGSEEYVANGEIGIVCPKWGNTFFNVEFSSQPHFVYKYKTRNGDESEQVLELAYALTVHKAQGSEFKTVILVLSDPCRLFSRELLYTAITRQKTKLVILFNKEAYHFRRFASKEFSDIARRYTNLFSKK